MAVQNPKFKARFKTIEIDYSQWEKRLIAILEKEIKRAAVTWLNATVLLSIPIWSGASRATFSKLARSVGFPLSISPVVSPDGKYALGPGVGFAKSDGKLNLDQARSGRVFFTYETSLWHLVYNEYNNANANPKAGRLFYKLKDPGPYNFQQTGADAFEDYARAVLELPSPWRALKFKAIRVG